MKKKPALLRKNAGISGLEAKRTIGLLGTSRGAGVTYTGMLLSFYFAMEKRIRTAFLECNDHKDFERLQNVYEWSMEEGKSFSLDRLTCYRQVAADGIWEIFSDDYGCFILDFGTDYISWKEEFMRCGTKIIIGDRAVWNLVKTAEFVGSLENVRRGRDWIYMIPCATKGVLNRMYDQTGVKFISVPYEPDPALLSAGTVKLFKNLFG